MRSSLFTIAISALVATSISLTSAEKEPIQDKGSATNSTTNQSSGKPEKTPKEETLALQVARREAKQVLIQASQGEVTGWFSMSIVDGVPLFEIREKERDAKARLQLALFEVAEEDSKDVVFALSGSQHYWSDIGVETIGLEKKEEKEKDTTQLASAKEGDFNEIGIDTKIRSDDRSIILRASMIRPETDLAGNFFTLLLEATIRAKDLLERSAIQIRATVQNYPYGMSPSTGMLLLNQLVTSTVQFDASKIIPDSGKIPLGLLGHLVVLKQSAIEDGNPSKLLPIKTEKLTGSRIPKCVADAKSLSQVQVRFSSIRPKNATFVEELIIEPSAFKQVVTAASSESKEAPPPQGTVKGMAVNSGNSLLATIGVSLMGLALSLALVLF